MNPEKISSKNLYEDCVVIAPHLIKEQNRSAMQAIVELTCLCKDLLKDAMGELIEFGLVDKDGKDKRVRCRAINLVL